MSIIWCYFSTNSWIDRKGKNYFALFYYELLNRLNGKNNFKVVSYRTNNFFLCSPLDKNFGVILHHMLRDGYVIQLD